MPGMSPRRWPLFALCGGLALLEAGTLHAVGLDSALPLAPQLGAPGALGTYHDLRWVFDYHWSWTSLVWELCLLLVFRTLVTAAVVWFSWPDDVPRPAVRRLAGGNLLLTAGSALVLSPWAAIAFAAQVVSFSWLMIASVAGSFVSLLLLPLAVTGLRGSRYSLLRAAGWAACAWLACTVGGLAVSLAAGWAAVAVAVVAALVDASVWLRLVHTAGRAPRQAPSRRIVSVVAAAAVGTVFLGGAAAIEPHGPRVGVRTRRSPADLHTVRPVLFMNGFDSSYDGTPFQLFRSGRYLSWYYSYRGLGAEGPLPYRPARTHQPIELSARRLAAQVAWLHRRTGHRVTLVAESEGTLVAGAYFARHPHAPVSSYVMLSPLPRPGRVSFPAAGRSGWGTAAGWEAGHLVSLVQRENPDLAVGPGGMRIAHFVSQHADRYRAGELCPVPGIPSYALIPLSEATVVYQQPVAHVPWVAIAGWHGRIIQQPQVVRAVRQVVTTGRLQGRRQAAAAFRWVSGASAAWQVPALPLSFRADWHARPGTDPALAGWHCPRR
jgi:hypothetical protein